MRIHRTATEWVAIIAEQKKSGTTIAAFCREKGIHPNVFYRKQKQFREGEQQFVRVQAVLQNERAGKIRIGDIEIEVRENVADDFLVRMIRSAIEARNVDVSR
jgi:transposase-like protein